jgi:hypothetical protein
MQHAIDVDEGPAADVAPVLSKPWDDARKAAATRMNIGKTQRPAAMAYATHTAPINEHEPSIVEEALSDLVDDNPDDIEPEPEQTQPAPAADPIQLVPVEVHHLDNLWDWVRQDQDRGAAFLGGVGAQSSLAIHHFFQTLNQREQLGMAMIRAIHLNSSHIGFAVLLPILEQQKIALAHLYINQQMRGFLTQLLPSLIHYAAQMRPDLRLVVMSDRPEWARLLAPLGFHQQIVLIRD